VKNKDIRFFFAHLICSLIYFSFVFLPVLTLPFAHHDDYYLFLEGNPFSIWWNLYIGRPFLLFGEYIITSLPIDTVFDLRPLRMISVLIISLTTSLFAYLLFKARFFEDRLSALLISASIFLSPGMLVYVLNVRACFVPISFTLALLSYSLLDRIDARSFFSLRLGAKDLLFLVLSFLTLLVSINIAQTAAMFFLVPCLALILVTNASWTDIRLIILKNLIIFSGVSVTTFLVHRFITHPYMASKVPEIYEQALSNPMYRLTLTTDIWGKINVFINDISVQALNLWNIYPKIFFALSIVFLIFLAATIKLSEKSLPFNHKLQTAVAVIFLIILSNLPNIISSGGYTAYRTTFVYTAMLILLVVWSARTLLCRFLKNREKITISIAIFLFVYGSFFAASNMLNSSVNNTLEHSFIRANLLAKINENPSSIHVIRSLVDKSFLNLPSRYDEFNIPSTNFWQDIPLIMHSIIKTDREVDGAISMDSFPYITQSRDEKVLFLPKDGILINMNDLLVPTKTTMSMYKSKREIATVTVSAATSGPRHGVIRAFDYSNDPDSFWEVGGSFPQWIQITYAANKKITGYEIQTGEGVERSPKAWQLQGSDDGVKWIVLDKRENEIDWKPNEKRTYNVENPGAYKYYRFFFTEENDPILRVYEIRMIYDILPTDK